jgi:hypothetical protein
MSDDLKLVYAVVERPSTGRNVFGALFFVWGFGGLLIFAMSIFGLGRETSPTPAFMGLSAFTSVLLTFWIGGMILFGIGALLCRIKYDVSASAPLPPLAP